MGVTVIGPNLSATELQDAGVLVVDIKPEWSASWSAFPRLEVEQLTLATGSSGTSYANLRFRYGEVVEPFEGGGDFQPITPNQVGRSWVRIRLERANQSTVVFVGKIRGDARAMDGETSLAGISHGTIRLVAYGGEDLLQRVSISKALVYEPATPAYTQRIGWLPSMNRRDARGFLLGNRSDVKRVLDGPATWVYGAGETPWSHFDYADYVLGQFVSYPNGPQWGIVGEAVPAIRDLQTVVQFGAVETALDILRAIMPREKGVDFFVRPDPEGRGFLVEVYYLSAREHSFAGKTLPRNSNEVRVDSPWPDEYLDVEVIESTEQSFDTVRIIGGRIVTVFSMSAGSSELTKGWGTDEETEYNRGTATPTDDARLHDLFRQGDRYRGVYQRFIRADGILPPDLDAAPLYTSSGEFVATDGADFQTLFERLLPWTPLREGYDYSQNPPFDGNISLAKPAQLPPFAFVKDPDSGIWFTTNQAGLAVSVEPDQWGVLIEAGPNHRLAYNSQGQIPKTAHRFPTFSWEEMVVTVAAETDQRLELEYSVAVSTPTSDASKEVKTIYVPEAEIWFLPAGTVVGVDDADPSQLATAPESIDLRNDSANLYLTMAGAIARYVDARYRARVTLRGLEPWSDLRGHLLTMVDRGGYSQHMSAPITEVTYTADPVPTTTIRAGFALGSIAQTIQRDPAKPNPLREPSP